MGKRMQVITKGPKEIKREKKQARKLKQAK
jgi:hypothetical protein